MEFKKSAIILLAVAITVNIVFINNGAAAAELIVHNVESIQKAVDIAVPGDTIIIKPGLYKEKISTHTNDLTIRALSDNPEDTIIEGPGFVIWGSNVTIKGFTVKGTDDYSGIAVLNKAGKCKIENNEISNYVSGIEIPIGSTFNVINNNKISDCQNGITVFEGIENNVKNNKISNCENGITFREGSGNLLNSNSILNCQFGITYMEGFENIISGNGISDCKYGINVGNGDATPLENRIQVENNTITKNEIGISVNGAGGGGYTVVSNNISFNKNFGYEDYSTGTNYIYNNYFNNTENVKLGTYSRPELTCVWNITRIPGPNIMGGPYIGGNYWATPSGNGFSQTHSDFNGDGTSERHYSLNGIDIDYLPLVLPSENLKPVLPIANFSTNATSGISPVSIKFTDTSRSATERAWDFENDGIIDSRNKIDTHVYTIPGTYTVNLTAGNANGINSKLAAITVLRKPIATLPIANFKANTTQGSVPLSIQFADLSQYTTSWNWDFNNDKISDSTDQNPVYVYSTPGNYIASLTVINENGTDSKFISVTAGEKIGTSPENSGEDSGNLNSNITKEKNHNKNSESDYIESAEPERNIEVKEVSKTSVRDGKLTRFDFRENKTCVSYLTFESNKASGKTIALVEMLKGKPALVSELPAGKVYRFFSIWLGQGKNIVPQNIKNAVICFKIEKVLLNNEGIKSDSIILNRYGDKEWHQLPTNFVKEDDNYLYFTTDTPGLASFAITGVERRIESENKVTINLEPENKAFNTHNIDENENKNEQEKTPDMPAFEIIYSIICFFGALIYEKIAKRK